MVVYVTIITNHFQLDLSIPLDLQNATIWIDNTIAMKIDKQIKGNY